LIALSNGNRAHRESKPPIKGAKALRSDPPSVFPADADATAS
jgi:hypothetical protein